MTEPVTADTADFMLPLANESAATTLLALVGYSRIKFELVEVDNPEAKEMLEHLEQIENSLIALLEEVANGSKP